MRILLFMLMVFLTVNAFSAHLKIINETGIPVQVKINKSLKLHDITEKEYNFQFKKLSKLRFFVQCKDLEKKVDTCNVEGNVTRTERGTYVDTFDVDSKIIFFQFTEASQMHLMNHFGLDGQKYFDIANQLKSWSEEEPEEEVLKAIRMDAATMQGILDNFLQKLKPGFEAMKENQEDHSEKEKSNAPKTADHESINSFKRKKALEAWSKALDFDAKLFSKERSDIAVTLMLDEKRNFVFKIDTPEDGLFHGYLTRKSQFHDGSANVTKTTIVAH